MKPLDEKIQVDDVVQSVYANYLEGMTNLQRPYPFLNNLSPLEYFAEGRLRFARQIPQRKKNSKDWRTLYKSAVIRNKILGIVAHLVGSNIAPAIVAQNEAQEQDRQLAQFLKDAVEWTQDKEDFDEKLFWAIVTACAEGTCILQDDYVDIETEYKDIDSVDEQTGKAKYVKKKRSEFKGCLTHLVPNDELLVPNPFTISLQDQDWVIRRKRMHKDIFMARFGKFPNADKVRPGAPQHWIYASDLFMPYYSVANLTRDTIEVLWQWKKTDDTLLITANGVGLTDYDNPIPRRDKKYPFAKAFHGPNDYGFFWGKSLTDMLAPEADVYDAMLRMVVDRQHLRNIPPLLTDNPALVNEDIIIPGNVTYTGEVSQKTVQVVPGFDSSTDAGTYNLLGVMEKRMGEGSIDPMQMGSSSGGQQTATQAIQMAQNARTMLGLFGYMIGRLVQDWTKLRLQTILWRLGHDGTEFEQITVADKKLANGDSGSRMYFAERGLSESTESEVEDLAGKIKQAENEMGGKTEIIVFDPDVAANLDYYVKVNYQPSPKKTDALSQALAMEKWNVMASNPQVWNLNYAAKQLAQAWSLDPDEAINQTGSQAQQVSASRSQPTPIMEQITSSLNSKIGLPNTNPANNQ